MRQLGYYGFGNLVDLTPKPGSAFVLAQTGPSIAESGLFEERLVDRLAHLGINEEHDHEPIQTTRVVRRSR